MDMEIFGELVGFKSGKFFPENNDTECSMANFPNCDAITLVPSTNGTGVSNFVSLCGRYNINGQAIPRCDLAEIIVYYSGAS